MNQHWFNRTVEETFQNLETGPEGITVDEARRRLEQYGPNEIEFRRTPLLLRFLKHFYDPMMIILIITAAVTGTLTALGSEMLPDTIVIIGVVVLNAILAFYQEERAEGALNALRDMLVAETQVNRAGKYLRVDSRELVPGDLVLLESGVKVSADLRIISAANLHIDESSLTGESIAASKMTDALASENLVPGDQSNMAFSGTYVTQGTARGIVVSTGRETVLGGIATMVQSAHAGLTPLQKKLKEFISTLITAILIVGGVSCSFGIYLGYGFGYSFLGAISLVVAAIPEMLPALVTSVLAISSLAMARRNALIRNLPAAETLGATSVICSDKTGTLTQNRMMVTRIFAGNEMFDVTGEGYEKKGEFLRSGEPVEVADNYALQQLLVAGYVCNDARIFEDGAVGDATEIALLVASAKAGIERHSKRIAELPFDSNTKYMAVLVEARGDTRMLVVKGAPEVVIDMCSATLSADGDEAPFDQHAAHGVADSFAENALRTLGLAYKVVPQETETLTHDMLEDLLFLGLEGMIDPPKQSAIEAIAKCRTAGIRTVMVTGDHPVTARAIARQIGIDSEMVVTGSELSELDQAQLLDIVKKASVFARVSPEHKKAIADAFKESGEIVAMTGDGVNDAPALKSADIGVAMGMTGTEVSREAADMVLADDHFATIVAAVEEGRHAWINLRKAILYTLPTNAAQALLILGAIVMAGFIPLFSVRFVLEPVQVLWINLLDSVLLTMPLMMEPKEEDLLHQPPRDPKIRIIDALFIQRVILMGFAIATPGFFVYYYFGSAAVTPDGVDDLLLTQAQTAAFWAVLLAHFGYAVSARSIMRSALTFNPFGNPWLMGGLALSVLIRFIPTFIPEAASLFRTAPFPIEWWWLISLCWIPSFVAIELDKGIRLHFRRKAARCEFKQA